MNGKTLLSIAALLLLWSGGPCRAQEPDTGATSVPAAPAGVYELRTWTVNGGGVSFNNAGGYTLGGTIGQPDAGTPRSNADYTLLGGFWRPACSAASVPVTISRSDNDVILAWTHDTDNQAYYVHRSTAPYFTPSPATRVGLVTASPWEYRDLDVLGDVDVNYTYAVRPACGAAWVDTGHRGEFEFGLTPGN